MINDLRKNVDTEIGILREISDYMKKLRFSTRTEFELLSKTIESLKVEMKLINNSLPKILKEISLAKKLPVSGDGRISKELERVEFRGKERKIEVVLKKSDKEKFLKQLSINDALIRKIKKSRHGKKEEYEEFKAARGYFKLSNLLFLDMSNNWIRRGRFKKLGSAINKSNIDILLSTYVSMMFFSVFLSFFLSLFLAIILLFVSLGFSSPYLSVYSGSYLARFLRVVLIPIIVPSIVFLFIYFYPSGEKRSLEKRIDQELPFAVIHMSAISGSGIEPSEIFKIIGLSQEYPFLKKEIRKVMNQINLYGYDLVTALSNASKITPSKKLSELFSGLATTITSGANLSEFFEKRSESLLVSYRLEREKYTKVAETFMDIYISVVIAAPMILLLLVVLLSITGAYGGFSPSLISIAIVSVVALLNVFFIWFLQIKQPSY